MWTLLITFVALLLALIAAAGVVSLAAKDQERGRRALIVLKMLLGATLGTGGVFVLIVQLRQVGLM